MTEILKRKTDHIDLVLTAVELAAQASPWDEVQLTHNALPEQDLLRFDLSTEFLGKRLRLPFLISSMTGGLSRQKRSMPILQKLHRRLVSPWVSGRSALLCSVPAAAA